jgi:CAAX protease family protein
MPTATENRQPAPLSPLKRLVVRHPVAAFLVMLYAIAWTVFLPVVLQARGLLALPVDLSEGFAFDAVTSLASIFGVALPAFLVTAATSGKAGVRDLLGRCLRWRVGTVWYLAALFGLLAVMVLAGSVLSDPAPLEVLTERWSLLFTLFLPEVLFPFVFIQIFEEAGWTGFMQHTLQERRGPLLASILVAPAFVLQHLPILLMDAGVGLASLIIVGALVVVAVFFRVVVTWLYNGSGRSVLVVALFHSAYNSAWGTGDHKFTGELISGPAATLIPIGVIAVVAVAVAVLSRGRLAHEPERGATTQGGGRSGPNEGATTNLLIASRVPARGDPVLPTEKGDSA